MLTESQGSLNDWNRVAAKLPGRTNKDCRKRWSKIPGHIKKGVWSDAEDQGLKSAIKTFGNRWTHVAQSVGTRNADQCAKRWHHSLDPSLDHSEWVPEDDVRLLASVASYGRVWKTIGEKEFPGRSATELKNRFVILDRKRRQELGSSSLRAGPNATVSASAPSHAEVDMQDSESTDSLSDDNEADVQDTEFNFDMLSHTASSQTTPETNFPQHTASALTTPAPYAPSQSVSTHPLPQAFSFPENSFTNDLYSRPPTTRFDARTDSHSQLNTQSFDLSASPWNMRPFHPSTPTLEGAEAPFFSPSTKRDEAMTGVEKSSEKSSDGSTLILEHVQPQMVTSIINLLFESKSVVKMKIVSQE